MGAPGPTELLILLFLLAVGAGIVLFLLASKRSNTGTSSSESQDTRQTLDERYARGELSRDEYRQMRRDIEG